MDDLLISFRRLVAMVEAHEPADRDKLVKALHAMYYGGVPTVRRGKAELKRLMKTDNKALRRIAEMADAPTCRCGRPTGLGAIRLCAEKALRAQHDRKETP